VSSPSVRRIDITQNRLNFKLKTATLTLQHYRHRLMLVISLRNTYIAGGFSPPRKN